MSDLENVSLGGRQNEFQKPTGPFCAYLHQLRIALGRIRTNVLKFPSFHEEIQSILKILNVLQG